jgi:hypothetical protein
MIDSHDLKQLITAFCHAQASSELHHVDRRPLQYKESGDDIIGLHSAFFTFLRELTLQCEN